MRRHTIEQRWIQDIGSEISITHIVSNLWFTQSIKWANQKQVSSSDGREQTPAQQFII